MRKTSLMLATVIALGVPALLAVPASAASPTLGCNVQPSKNDNFTSNCTGYAASSYTVSYLVQGQTGTDSYAWTYPTGDGITVGAGCTATSSSCALSVQHGSQDQYLVATVVVTQDGSQVTLSSEAILPAVCGSEFC